VYSQAAVGTTSVASEGLLFIADRPMLIAETQARIRELDSGKGM
jgi:hypothetical protein